MKSVLDGHEAIAPACSTYSRGILWSVGIRLPEFILDSLVLYILFNC